MSRPVLLLPSSKGKAEGGTGRSYGATLDGGPLADARRRILAAVEDAARRTDDTAFARISGLGARATAQDRDHHADLGAAPTMPAGRRYTGVVHGNAGLADLDAASCEVRVHIVSALFGLARLGDPVPDYRLELGASLPGIGGVATFWRSELAEVLRRATAGARVWDLLPGEHARVWPASARTDADVVSVRFLRPDGRPANAARAKVCKGRLAAALLAWPDASPSDLVAWARVGPGWELTATRAGLTATFAG